MLLCFSAFILLPAPIARAAETIVFLGDSITAADVYVPLVRQAILDTGTSAPVCVNAGVNGDTAAGMLKRLERDVLAKKPTLVTLSAGINDSRLKVSEADYEKTVTAIAERVTNAGARLVVMTTTVLGKGREDRAATCEKYDAVLRRVAEKYGAPVAEVKAAMRAGDDGTAPLLKEDQVHPTFAGHRLIARAVLDALGHKDAPVPAALPEGAKSRK